MWINEYLKWCKESYQGETWEDIMEMELEAAYHNQRFLGASVYTDLDRLENDFKIFFWEHVEIDELNTYLEDV